MKNETYNGHKNYKTWAARFEDLKKAEWPMTRESAQDLYLTYFNNFLTVRAFSEYLEIPIKDGHAIVKMGHVINKPSAQKEGDFCEICEDVDIDIHENYEVYCYRNGPTMFVCTNCMENGHGYSSVVL